MQGRNVNQLAQALSESERRELIERIQRSLNLAKKEQAPIYHAPANQEYRDRMIHHDMQELSLMQRLSLWFKRVFGGRNDVDAFIEIKLAGIGKKLDMRHLADPAARTLDPHLAELLLRLYLRLQELGDFFEFLWGSEANLMSTVSQILANRIPHAKSAMDDFVSPAEMEKFFETLESKSGLRAELLERLHTYLEGIPADVFSRMEEGLLPLYYLKELSLMDFGPLFRAFQSDLPSIRRGIKPDFKSAAADKVMGDLEKLYFCIHTAMKGGEGDSLHQEIFELFKNRPRITIPSEPGAPDIQGLPEPELAAPEAVEGLSPLPENLGGDEAMAAEALKNVAETQKKEGASNFRRMIKELGKEIVAFAESALLADVIKYFQGDPYYKFLAYVPSLNIKEFYYATTRMKILDELDRRYTQLRERIIKKITNNLFPHRYVEFEHYRRTPVNMTRSGLPTFRYVDSLCLVFNYTSQIYMPYLKELLKVLVKALPSRSRESQGEFTFHMNGLETIHEQLKALDHSFAPENAEGKNLTRIRLNMERDPSQDRAYRIYVVQKEKDIKPILEESLEHLKSLGLLLDEVLKMPEEMINERFQHILGVSTQGGYYSKFRIFGRDITALCQAVRYQRTLEEERV